MNNNNIGHTTPNTQPGGRRGISLLDCSLIGKNVPDK